MGEKKEIRREKEKERKREKAERERERERERRELLRKTEDIVHKVEGCQDLVQLSPPLPSVSAANASSTGHTLPVALVATGVVVGAGATTAMTAPVATIATPRPSTSRPARRHVLPRAASGEPTFRV